MKPDLEKKLYDLTLEKWSINKTWMKKRDFKEFISNKLSLEQFQDLLIKQLQTYIGHLDSRPILDVGCGEGGLVVALNLKGFHAFGIDPNEKNIQISMLRARKNDLQPSIFKKASANALPFDDKSFAVLTLVSVLEHVKDIPETLREASRVLKDDGYLFAIVPNKYWPIEGHVDLWFVHWLPLCIRRLALGLLRKEKGKDLNYLEPINYYGPAQWSKFLSFHFSKIHDVRKQSFETLLSSIKDTRSKRKIIEAIKYIVATASNYSSLKKLIFHLYTFFQPRIYLVAQK
jgi:ubiquinone/menaquinone biosynthesis C-methylase UbiE